MRASAPGGTAAPKRVKPDSAIKRREHLRFSKHFFTARNKQESGTQIRVKEGIEGDSVNSGTMRSIAHIGNGLPGPGPGGGLRTGTTSNRQEWALGVPGFLKVKTEAHITLFCLVGGERMPEAMTMDKDSALVPRLRV